jgi:ubiquinone/menaquinone biosynthesis C-methylase UbiE
MKPPVLPKELLEALNKIYSEKSEIYDKMSQRQDFGNHILKTVLKDVDFRNKTILELGAGTGRFSISLSRKAKLLYALDKSRPMLKLLRRKIRAKGIRNIRILESDYRKIPLPKESVDIAFSVWSFPHNSAVWEKDLGEIKRVLKPGGRMVFVDNYYGGGEYVRMKRAVNESAVMTRRMERFSRGLHRWLVYRGFRYKVIDTLMDFGSKRNVERLCGPIFGYDKATYLLARGKTSFGMKVSIFYGKK